MKRSEQSSFFQRNPFFKVLFREIDRMSGSPIYLFCTLIGPLFAFIILLITFSESIPRNIPIALVDRDQTTLSRKIGMYLNVAPEANIKIRVPDIQEAYRQMALGNIDAVVIIPENTEKNILKGMQQKIPVFISNLNILKGGYLQKGIYKTLATISTGLKVQMAMKKGLSKEQALTNAMPVKLHQHILFNPFGNYAYFLLTALLPLMVVVFTLLTTIFSVGTEVKEGTGPDWLEHSSGSIIVALAGKLFPYTVLYSVISMVMNVILFIQIGAPLHGSFFLIALGELGLVITYQFVGVLFIAILSNMRLALSVGSAYSMMALTFSGLTFPAFGMPVVAEGFSYFFPFTYWIHIFVSQAIQGAPEVEGIKYLSIFVIFILLSVCFFPRLKRILQTEKFWGKI